MRKLILLTCLFMSSHFALAAQTPVVMRDFAEVPVTVLDPKEEPTLEQVKKDVIMAALRLGWELQNSTTSEVYLHYGKRDFDVDIRAKFSTKTVKIEYVSSNNLGYAKREDGMAVIHPNYNRWIANLLKSILPLAQQQRLKNVLSSEPAPENSIVIHYHRKKMDYDGWGLHIWGNGFETTTSWFKPVMSAKTDAFGAIYILKAAPASADEQTAFFVLHNGDSKDKCSQEQSWDPRQGREIFMVSGDCKIYFSGDEALNSSYF